MSRKGRGRSRPPLKIRILPVFSTRNRRVVSPGAAARSTGCDSPPTTNSARILAALVGGADGAGAGDRDGDFPPHEAARRAIGRTRLRKAREVISASPLEVALWAGRTL